MHVRPIQFDAAIVRWSPQDALGFTGADDALLSWLQERNVGTGSLSVIHEHEATVTGSAGVLASLSAGGRSEVMKRGVSLGSRDGCVVLAFPKLERLSELSRGLRAGGIVVVFEYGAPPTLDGWMAATGAYDLSTGETTPPLDDELHDTFVAMLMWEREIGGGAQRGKQRGFVQRPLATLKSAGLDEYFVITYCAALGLSDNYLTKLQAHYKQA